MKQELELDGNRFSTLAEFYDEVERQLTKGLDWKIGRNLDAYNDVLRGGFGRHKYEEAFVLRWKNSEKSRNDFGWPATVAYHEDVLAGCHPDNIPYVKEKVENAKRKEGQTLFDILLEITTGHEHIELVLA